MQRLNAKTLPVLMRRPEISVILFGDPLGALMMAQAEEFAKAWLDRHGEAAFGYADAFECAAAARALGVRKLPTTAILSGGDVVALLEGLNPAASIEAAMDRAATPMARAA